MIIINASVKIKKKHINNNSITNSPCSPPILTSVGQTDTSKLFQKPVTSLQMTSTLSKESVRTSAQGLKQPVRKVDEPVKTSTQAQDEDLSNLDLDLDDLFDEDNDGAPMSPIMLTMS